MKTNSEKETFFYSKTPYAEIHLHFGGAISPRMIWHKVQADHIEENGTNAGIRKIGSHKTFESFQNFFDSPKKDLQDYLKMHSLIEPFQTLDTLDYYIGRLMRGAFEFESLSYMELRHCPWNRTTHGKSDDYRIHEMEKIVRNMDEAMKKYSTRSDSYDYYPIIMKQILCLNARESEKVNDAIFELAKEMFKAGIVCGLDIASGEDNYNGHDKSKIGHEQIIKYFKKAKDLEMKTTAHIFETEDTPEEMFKLLQYLDRIGHGIMIPLKYPEKMDILREKEICLEICPTTYFKYGTLKKGYYDSNLKKIFKECEKNEVDITIGTDNGGFHGVRLQSEFERLLIHEVVSHKQLDHYRENAFKHAFGLSDFQKKMFMEDHTIHINF